MQRKSTDTVKIEYAVQRQKLEKALRNYLKRASTRAKLHEAILFGSYAKNNYSPGSDIDLAIVADDLPANATERYAMFKETVLGLDLQPFVYTKQEWNEMIKSSTSFASEIRLHGRRLYPER